MDETSDAEHVLDTYPLLMDHPSPSTSSSTSVTPDHTVVQVDHHPVHAASGPPPPSSSSSSTSGGTSNSASSRTSRSNSYSVPRQRISPLNSGLWISIELTITVSQIVASVIVLSLSRDEKPQAPLSVWVAGYAAGCLATLPLLYWRYTHRSVASSAPQQLQQQQNQQQQQQQNQGPSPSLTTPASSVTPSSSYVALNMPSGDGGRHRESDSENSGVARLIEKFKIALDCFFAVWFVVGNVWIFGGHSSSREAPNLYRLCIVFLTFSCIGYAMPFILCATICCCLPCIIALLGFREEQAQNRGATPELIASLPTYKFKAGRSSHSTEGKEGSDTDSEPSVESGGLVAAGTDKERAVSADDAVCCICLARYKDGEPLRELSCSHHFHVDCVDKWLKINASCPLCKLDVGGSNDTSAAAAAAANETRRV